MAVLPLNGPASSKFRCILALQSTIQRKPQAHFNWTTPTLLVSLLLLRFFAGRGKVVSAIEAPRLTEVPSARAVRRE
jgi:hypothetical protein